VRDKKYEVSLPELESITAYWDPAVCHTEQSDYASIVVVGHDTHGFLYVLEAYVERQKPDKQIQALVQLCKRWNVSKVVVESNGFQHLLVSQVRKHLLDEELTVRVLAQQNSCNKKLRIAGLEPLFSNKTLLLNRRISPLLIDQLKYFPTATHDDAVDALAGAVEGLVPSLRRAVPLQRRNITRRPRQHV
jgi:predicted phage terminase large subunit-like protein